MAVWSSELQRGHLQRTLTSCPSESLQPATEGPHSTADHQVKMHTRVHSPSKPHIASKINNETLLLRIASPLHTTAPRNTGAVSYYSHLSTFPPISKPRRYISRSHSTTSSKQPSTPIHSSAPITQANRHIPGSTGRPQGKPSMCNAHPLMESA